MEELEDLVHCMFRFQETDWIQAISNDGLSWSDLFDLIQRHSTSIDRISTMIHDLVLAVPVHPLLPDAFRFWKHRVPLDILREAVWEAFVSFQFIGDSMAILERHNVEWTGNHQIQLSHVLLWSDLQKWLH